MSVVIPKGAKFLGTSLVTVRNLLRLWDRYGEGSAHAFAHHGTVRLSPITTAVLIDELEQRGMIGSSLDRRAGVVPRGVTEAGKGLVVAQATRRTVKSKAAKVLDTVLDAAEAINARRDLPFRVKELWLFGSMIDPAKDDVGDIDLVPVFEDAMPRKPYAAMSKRYWKLAEELGGPLEEFRWRLNEDSWVRNRLLYGPRRHPLVAPNDVDRVASLGCPCKRIFDVSRGGRVDDDVLPRHPTSNGRDSSAIDPRVMPDLAPAPGPVEPVDIALLLPEQRLEFDHFKSMTSGMAVLDDEGWSTWRHHSGRAPTILRSDDPEDHVGRDPVLNPYLHRLDLDGCDGRSRFGMLLQRPGTGAGWSMRPAGCGMVIGRTFEEGDGHVLYRVRIEQFLDDGQPQSRQMMELALWAIQAAMQADLERLMLRRVEAGLPCIVLTVATSASDAKLPSFLAAEIQRTSDFVAIETAMRADCMDDYAAALIGSEPAASPAPVP